MRTSSTAKPLSLGCPMLVVRLALAFTLSSVVACSGGATPGGDSTPDGPSPEAPTQEAAGADGRGSAPSNSPGVDEEADAPPAPSSAGCAQGVTPLKLGTKIVFGSTANGNASRDYCFELQGNARISVKLSGGVCNNGRCIGDDVELHLKHGAKPDAFSPDSSTTSWTYTPASGGFGDYGKVGKAGAWYLSLIDSANTLGYKNVALTVTAQ